MDDDACGRSFLREEFLLDEEADVVVSSSATMGKRGGREAWHDARRMRMKDRSVWICKNATRPRRRGDASRWDPERQLRRFEEICGRTNFSVSWDDKASTCIFEHRVVVQKKSPSRWLTRCECGLESSSTASSEPSRGMWRFQAQRDMELGRNVRCIDARQSSVGPPCQKCV